MDSMNPLCAEEASKYTLGDAMWGPFRPPTAATAQGATTHIGKWYLHLCGHARSKGSPTDAKESYVCNVAWPARFLAQTETDVTVEYKDGLEGKGISKEDLIVTPIGDLPVGTRVLDVGVPIDSEEALSDYYSSPSTSDDETDDERKKKKGKTPKATPKRPKPPAKRAAKKPVSFHTVRAIANQVEADGVAAVGAGVDAETLVQVLQMFGQTMAKDTSRETLMRELGAAQQCGVRLRRMFEPVPQTTCVIVPLGDQEKHDQTTQAREGGAGEGRTKEPTEKEEKEKQEQEAKKQKEKEEKEKKEQEGKETEKGEKEQKEQQAKEEKEKEDREKQEREAKKQKEQEEKEKQEQEAQEEKEKEEKEKQKQEAQEVKEKEEKGKQEQEAREDKEKEEKEKQEQEAQ